MRGTREAATPTERHSMARINGNRPVRPGQLEPVKPNQPNQPNGHGPLRPPVPVRPSGSGGMVLTPR